MLGNSLKYHASTPAMAAVVGTQESLDTTVAVKRLDAALLGSKSARKMRELVLTMAVNPEMPAVDVASTRQAFNDRKARKSGAPVPLKFEGATPPPHSTSKVPNDRKASVDRPPPVEPKRPAPPPKGGSKF